MNKHWKLAAQCGAAVLAVLFILYGVSRGEAGVVMTKAIYVCLECIGLG